MVLSMLLPASAQGASWKSAGTIAVSEGFGPLSATVDRNGGSVFVWQDARGLLERARPRRGPFAPERFLAPTARDATPVAGNAPGEAVQAWDETAPQFAERVREVAAL